MPVPPCLRRAVVGPGCDAYSTWPDASVIARSSIWRTPSMRRPSSASNWRHGALAARWSLQCLDGIAEDEVHSLDRASGLFGEHHVEPRHLSRGIGDDGGAQRHELVDGGDHDQQQQDQRDCLQAAADGQDAADGATSRQCLAPASRSWPLPAFAMIALTVACARRSNNRFVAVCCRAGVTRSSQPSHFPDRDRTTAVRRRSPAAIRPVAAIAAGGSGPLLTAASDCSNSSRSPCRPGWCPSPGA